MSTSENQIQIDPAIPLMNKIAITRTIELLQTSKDSLYTDHSVNEVVAALQAIQAEFEQTGQLDQSQLNLLFAPTGPIQETAIDNDWGEEFLSLAKEVDKLAGKRL